MKYSWVDISNDDFEQLFNECPEGSYLVVNPDEAGNLIPTLSKAHLAKADSVLIMCSGTNSGVAYYMANINRVENGTLQIDQDPLGFAVFENQPLVSGCYIQHGDWMGRTIMPPDEFSEYVLSSGLGNCFPLPTLPPKSKGSIEELHNSSQEKAFEKLIKQITVVFPDD
jgi:hypothetical protein